MNIDDIKKLKVGKVIENIDLKKYTTYKAGGIGRVLVIPKDIESLQKLFNYINKNNIKYKMLGLGSNLIFGDDIYEGILIKLDEFNDVNISGTTIRVGAGYSLIKLSLLSSIALINAAIASCA